MMLEQHAEMSRRVREYFQNSDPRRETALRVAEVATMVNLEYAVEQLTLAEKVWNEAFRRQNYTSPEMKDIELDACRAAHQFWGRVVQLKKGV